MIKLEVRLDDGSTKKIEVKEYEPEEMAKELNKTNSNMIAIGDLVVQRFSVTRVSKIDDKEN